MSHNLNSCRRLRGLAALVLVFLSGCSANSGPPWPSVTTTIPAPAAAALTLELTPQAIPLRQAASLTWTSAHATHCSASGAWSGDEQLTNQAGFSTGAMNTAGVYSFALTCAGLGGSASAVQTLIVGQAPAPLVSVQLNPASIQPGQSTALTWSSANALACTGSGGTGTDGWVSKQPTSGSLNVGPVAASGSYPYTLTCTGPGGTGTDTAILTVSSSAPANPPVVTIGAAPTQISPGASVTLTWTISGATACTATGGVSGDGWSGAKSAGNGSATVGPINTAGSYTYTLNCLGSGGSASASATVLVGALQLPTVQISVNPLQIAIGAPAFLTWVTTNATSCTASGSWSGSQPLQGSAVSTGTLSTVGTYSYTLTCTGPGGQATGTATLSVLPPPPIITGFIATPANLEVGQSTLLTWTSTNATACTGSGGTAAWLGAQPTASLATVIGPIGTAGSYVFTLTCQGPGGSSGPASVTVNVSAVPPPPQITALTITPTHIATGTSATIAWSTLNATSCTASGGASGDGWAGPVGPSSAGLSVGPITVAGTYTYTLVCNGPGGQSAPSSAALSVGAAPLPATITSFTALPGNVPAGQSVTLTWSSANATSCVASGGTGTDGWNGPQPTSSGGLVVGPLNLVGTVTYTLTCSGPGGSSGPTSASVTVTAVTPPAAIIVFTATPNSVDVGASVVIAWATTNATSCAASGGTGSDGWNGTLSASGAMALPPFTVAGNYTYHLTCSGPGGASAPAAVTVAVGAATPPAAIDSLAANPSALQSGQSTMLSWTSSNATACTASGGTGAWTGSMPTSSTGFSIGPINSTGIFVFTLVCSGPGGSSGPSSVVVTVSAVTPPATITSFAAQPAAVLVGQSTALTWGSSNATTCAATGGTGTDGWAGSVPTSSDGQVVGPFTAAGTVTYTLTCSGPGGSSGPASLNVTVTTPPPGPPTVTLTANGAATASIQPGADVTLRWSTTNATACTASGGTGADGWPGTQPTASAGTTIGPIKTPGIYAYTLTCTGPGGSASASVVVTVISSASADCGVGVPTTALLAPAASVSTDVNGLCLLGCGVANPANVIDSDSTNYATMTVALGVAADVSLSVTDNSTSFPAGRQVGFLVADPGTLLTLSLIPNVTVRTLLNGTVQQSVTNSSLLQLSALGSFADPDEAFLSFQSSKPFNEVQIEMGSLVSAGAVLNVYQACVSLQ